MLPGIGGWAALPEVAAGGSGRQRNQTRLRLDRHMDDRTVSFPIVRDAVDKGPLYGIRKRETGWMAAATECRHDRGRRTTGPDRPRRRGADGGGVLPARPSRRVPAGAIRLDGPEHQG